MYPSLATRLVSAPSLPALRLDYRRPAYMPACVPTSSPRCPTSPSGSPPSALSSGGAPATRVAAAHKGRVAGVAIVASQTRAMSGIQKLAPEVPVLIMHGTEDMVISARCAEDLYDWYGDGGDRALKLFSEDDHDLTQNAPEVEKLLVEFARKCLERRNDTRDVKTIGNAVWRKVGSPSDAIVINRCTPGWSYHRVDEDHTLTTPTQFTTCQLSRVMCQLSRALFSVKSLSKAAKTSTLSDREPSPACSESIFAD